MPSKKYSGKLLPTQQFFRYLYRSEVPLETAMYEMVESYAKDFESSSFNLTTPKTVDFEEMSTPPWQLLFFNTLIALAGAKTVLEIGTFIGHSTMQFARMVGAEGHVTTIELGEEFAKIAQENFRRNGFDHQITIKQGNAGAILEQLPPASFDLVFVDGSKQDYLDYTLKSKRLLTERGIIVVDDVFFHGDALNTEPTTEKGRGCKKLLDHFKTDTELGRLLLPLANGILLLYKNRNALH